MIVNIFSLEVFDFCVSRYSIMPIFCRDKISQRTGIWRNMYRSAILRNLDTTSNVFTEKLQHYFAKLHKFHQSMIALRSIQKYIRYFDIAEIITWNYISQEKSLSKMLHSKPIHKENLCLYDFKFPHLWLCFFLCSSPYIDFLNGKR